MNTITTAQPSGLRVGDVVDIYKGYGPRARLLVTEVTGTTMTVQAYPLPWRLRLWYWFTETVPSWNPCNIY